MSETELDLARRIAAGTARSPTQTPEFTWFAMRFSGTGTAWREQHQEHVIRPPEIFLAQEMQDRVAGVPVVWLHPEKGGLDSATFEKSVVGTIAFGYVANSTGIQDESGDELWVLTRIYDAEAIGRLSEEPASTSPAVIFDPQHGNETLPLQDGTHVLIESRPAIISHLACVASGVWDRDGGPTGIRIDSKEITMTERTPEEKARDDATGGNIDKLLERIDASIASRFDAMEARHRRDSERDGWMKADAAGCARDDAEEEKERGELEAKGDPKEVAADKARTARKDRMDKRRSDANPQGHTIDLPHHRADATAERKNSVDNAEIQYRFDAAAGAWGERAPPPMQAELPIDYRVRLLRHHQKYCGEPSFKDIDLAAIARTTPAVLDGIEKRIIADSIAASRNPIGPDERLVKRQKRTESGHEVTEWFGRETIFKKFGSPAQHVTAFKTPQWRGERGMTG